MPYIPPKERKEYDNDIDSLVHLLLNKLPGDNGKHHSAGDLNYIISSIVWNLFEANKSYTNGNALMGALECAKLEFYRRLLAEYEDKKIEENGDI